MRALLALFCGTVVVTACSVPEVTFKSDDGGLPDPGRPGQGDAGQPDSRPDEHGTATLTVSRTGPATGRVSAQSLELACTDVCTATVAIGAAVTLVASPDPGAVFAGWTGGCSSADTTCSVTVTADLAVAARFDTAMFTVAVGITGSGGGTVVSTPGGVACPGTCSTLVPYNATVELVASPDEGSTFMGWSGACSGGGTCSLTVTADTTVTAELAPNNQLAVTRAGNGGGTVSSSPGDISCGHGDGDVCTQRFPPHALVTLSAVAAGDSSFVEWSGACTGSDACQVTMDRAASVTATFALRKHNLQVALAGAGVALGGVVTSSPAGIVCRLDCDELFDAHTQVTLTAFGTAESMFTRWSGACDGTDATCSITVEDATSVTATFVPRPFELTVARAGNGSGSVTSSPPGISCGTDCAEFYDVHTRVTLTATPASDSVFVGWSRGCGGSTPTCTVTIDSSTAVTATFALKTFAVTVTCNGNGHGTVTSSPPGISCGSNGTVVFDAHSQIMLTATPASDSVFVGWTGCISTTTLCTVTVEQITSVTATFALRTFALTVTRDGNGSGSVTSSPPGISCGTDCTELYGPHTQVTLTAAAAADSVFTGWSGGCGGSTPTCTVTIEGATAVTASFARTFALTVDVTGTGIGSVQSDPAGISCGRDCTEVYNEGTTVTLTASANAGTTFVGWSGACSGDGACTVTMERSLSTTATFASSNGLLVVGNFNGHSVAVFAATANGDVAPLRMISGPLTTLTNPRGVTVANNEIIVADQGAQAIDFFPITAAGDVAPVRRIVGASTGLSAPTGPLVFGGELYVTQQTGPILVFPVSASGDVSPSRTISGFGTGIRYIAITDGEVYATRQGSIIVFPASTNGPAVPTRTIGGAGTGLSNPSGILVHDGEILVSNINSPAIRVFAQTANGGVAPLRVIAGPATQLNSPDQIAIFSGELYSANFTSNSVLVHPIDANGDVAPTRQIFGATTLLNTPTGAFGF